MPAHLTYHIADYEQRITKKVTRKEAKTTKKTLHSRNHFKILAEAEPVVECWRPAGVEDYGVKGIPKAPGARLGVARSASWRLNGFVTALRAEVQCHDDTCKIETHELDPGGETLIDFYIDFSSEAIASAILKKLDGTLLMGRQLQVRLL